MLVLAKSPDTVSLPSPKSVMPYLVEVSRAAGQRLKMGWTLAP